MPDLASALLDLVTHGGKLAMEHVAYRMRRREEQQEQQAIQTPPIQPLQELQPIHELAPLPVEPLMASPPTANPIADTVAKPQTHSVAASYSTEWEEDPAVACAACTRRHLATMAEAARSAAEARTPEERRRNLAVWAGEGLVWHQYDVSPEKLARARPEHREAVAGAVRAMSPLLDSTPKAPERLVLAWAATGEALRFARSTSPTERDRQEIARRMADVEGWIGYLESSGDPALRPHLPGIREARHRLHREGYTPETLEFCEGRLRQAAVALTPDLGPEDCRDLHRRTKEIRDRFYAAMLRGMQAQKPASVPSGDIEGINLSGAYYDTDTRPPESLVRAYLEGHETQQETGPLGDTPETRRAFENLARFNAARNVPVRAEPLPSLVDEKGGWEMILGAYFPQGNHIYVGPQAVVEAPKDLYTLAEETAHSLLHNPRCNPYQSKGLRYEDMPEEKEAKTAAMLALLNATMPFETDAGRRIDPSRVRANIAALEAGMGPTMAKRVQWAANVIAEAIRGDTEGALREAPKCPLSKVA